MPRMIPNKKVTRGRHRNHRVIIRTATPGKNGPVTTDISAWAKIKALRSQSILLGQPQGASQSSQAQYSIEFGNDIAVKGSDTIIHGGIAYKILDVQRPPDAPILAICTTG